MLGIQRQIKHNHHLQQVDSLIKEKDSQVVEFSNNVLSLMKEASMEGSGISQKGLGKVVFKTSKQVLKKDRRKKKQLELGPRAKKQ